MAWPNWSNLLIPQKCPFFVSAMIGIHRKFARWPITAMTYAIDGNVYIHIHTRAYIFVPGFFYTWNVPSEKREIFVFFFFVQCALKKKKKKQSNSDSDCPSPAGNRSRRRIGSGSTNDWKNGREHAWRHTANAQHDAIVAKPAHNSPGSFIWLCCRKVK